MTDTNKQKTSWTTQEVADQLQVAKRKIITAMNRHTHLKPTEYFGQNLVWSAEKVAALKAHFANTKIGRPEGK